MKSTPIDDDTKLKILEMQLSNLKAEVETLKEFNVELKHWLVRIAANQAVLSERLNKWPWMPSPETTQKD